MKPYEEYDSLSRTRINEYLKKKSPEAEYRYYRPQRSYGDLSFDFQRSRIPLIREEIESLSDSRISFSVTGKFVNAKYDDQSFSRRVIESSLDNRLFHFPSTGRKIQVEHTSANPTGPLHIGRVRNSIIGDTMAQILRAYGNEVFTEYYVNDIGTQVEALLLGAELFGEENYTESYRKIFENMDDYKERVEELMLKAETGDVEFLTESRRKLGVFLNDVLTDLTRLSIKFDGFTWESEFIINGSAKKVLSMFSSRLEDDNGAKYIDSPEGRMYLMRSNGTTVYFTRDIAYHLRKAETFDLSIDVLGEDHRNHFRKVAYALKSLGKENISALFYSFISTREGKMSTRRGNVIYVRDLISGAIEKAKQEILRRRSDLSQGELDEISTKIGLAAVRYNIVKNSPEKPVTFDYDEALNFEGDAAPFIMYSYARARSILSKIGKDSAIDWKFEKEELDLVRIIALYPEILAESSDRLRPDKIAKYSYDLASSFNQFYRDCPVLDSGSNYQRRVEIVRAFAKTMEELFRMLGIEASEKI